jgi:polyisoprenoid-binding protein YceI
MSTCPKDLLARKVAALALLLAASAAGGSATAGALPAPGTYALDPPHTFVEFRAQHKIVDVSIDAASLSTQNPVRDADVKGPDFFDAAKFPVITYKGKGIRKTGHGWVTDGTLTIRGLSKTVPLEFRFNGIAPAQPDKPDRLGFHATAALQRATFGMTRELRAEIGKESKAPDVWIDIDAEALGEAPQKK